MDMTKTKANTLFPQGDVDCGNNGIVHERPVDEIMRNDSMLTNVIIFLERSIELVALYSGILLDTGLDAATNIDSRLHS